ncbi:hypothetical protein NDU88_001800 [Pleurodeles waltl]|uniref:Uncharacterized protein n=1 Tax=Pleurodeles waltl TaxID=8319 RepID=A0AAV7MQY1_PLEWA|nr:hypothetical protein NDU88_001800 [Pleurodeles waltl]
MGTSLGITHPEVLPDPNFRFEDAESTTIGEPEKGGSLNWKEGRSEESEVGRSGELVLGSIRLYPLEKTKPQPQQRRHLGVPGAERRQQQRDARAQLTERHRAGAKRSRETPRPYPKRGLRSVLPCV